MPVAIIYFFFCGGGASNRNRYHFLPSLLSSASSSFLFLMEVLHPLSPSHVFASVSCSPPLSNFSVVPYTITRLILVLFPALIAVLHRRCQAVTPFRHLHCVTLHILLLHPVLHCNLNFVQPSLPLPFVAASVVLPFILFCFAVTPFHSLQCSSSLCIVQRSPLPPTATFIPSSQCAPHGLPFQPSIILAVGPFPSCSGQREAPHTPQ